MELGRFLLDTANLSSTRLGVGTITKLFMTLKLVSP